MVGLVQSLSPPQRFPGVFQGSRRASESTEYIRGLGKRKVSARGRSLSLSKIFAEKRGKVKCSTVFLFAYVIYLLLSE